MAISLDSEALARLFIEALSIQAFVDRPVSEETVRRLYDLVKLAPTGFNSQPGRYVFVRSAAAKDRLAYMEIAPRKGQSPGAGGSAELMRGKQQNIRA